MELSLTAKQQKILINIARIAIENQLGIQRITAPLDEIKTDNLYLSEKYGSFVTLTMHGNLRGCIGYITPVSDLMSQIENCAISAAFNDPRFNPLTEEEYKKIDMEISLLSPIEEVKNIEDIVVGRDGLIISKGVMRGLLLPQVATEYGWTREEFLDQTCVKAGLLKGCWTEKEIKIEKFSAYVFGEEK
jgi:AmmeMemoRadiSam system protein A